MRDASVAAKAFFASRAPGFYADLFTLILPDGTMHFWTNLDVDVTYGGTTWLAQSPNLQRSALSVRNTVEVPKLKVTMTALDDDFVGGTNVKAQIHNGEFDGARFLLERLPMTFPGDTSLGPPVLMFGGPVGKVDITAVGATIDVRGDVVLMNQYAPRNVFQSSCQWTFCDAGCTLLAANFTAAFVVGNFASISFIPWVSPPVTPSNYVRGRLRFTSGVNVGQSRSIRAASSAGVLVTYPFFVVPVAGDAFDALKGCDKTFNTGSGQDCTAYANTQHFRGFEFIPQPEYSI